jgi:tellurite resistance protein TerC
VWVVFALVFYFIIKFNGHLIHGITGFDRLQEVAGRYAPQVQLIPGDFERSLGLYLENLSFEFITGYVLEYALSVDNIFVIIVIFTSFNVREKYYKKGAVLGHPGRHRDAVHVHLPRRRPHPAGRVGAVPVRRLPDLHGHPHVLSRDGDDAIEPDKHPVVRFAARRFAVFPRYVGSHFFVKNTARRCSRPCSWCCSSSSSPT